MTLINYIITVLLTSIGAFLGILLTTKNIHNPNILLGICIGFILPIIYILIFFKKKRKK